MKKILLAIITLGIYPLVKKQRDTSLEKRTRKYYKDGTLRKDVEISFITKENDTDVERINNALSNE